jgi:hypothetical protein
VPPPGTLRCYTIRKIDIDHEAEVRRLSTLFDFKDVEVTNDGSVFRAAEAGTKRFVDWIPSVGVIWMEDGDQLWNPKASPGLLTDAEAAVRARAFLEDSGLLPESHGDLQVTVGEAMVASTLRNADDGDEPDTPLDKHVAIPVEVQVNGTSVPLFGRGSKWSVTFGDKGSIINCVAARLRIGTPSSVMDSATLPEQLVEDLGSILPQKPGDYALVYERVVDTDMQEWLLPMYVGSIDSRVGPQLARFPATELSRRVVEGFRRQLPSAVPFGAPGIAKTLAEIRADKVAAGAGRMIGTWSVDGEAADALQSEDTKGFADEMRKAGWDVHSFDGAAAREEHWNGKCVDFAEQVDLAHFSGHASPRGWQLTPPHNEMFDVTDIGNAQLRFGSQFVNWIVISGCGPLQDPVVTPGTGAGQAISRWRPAFGGLLGLCGFANTSLPSPNMGAVFARALSEYSVPRAWLRACRECQSLMRDPHGLGEFGMWAAALVVDDDDLRAFEMSARDSLKTRERRAPKRLLGMWTPV